jgi:ATP-dependent RNA helicase RhlE
MSEEIEEKKIFGFEDLKLSPEMLETIKKAGYFVPTPIQEQAIPVILEGRDVVGSAQTGSGKTATFAIPIVERLAGRGGTLAVVLSPTREIAQQTFDTFEVFGKPRGVRSVVLIGGVDMKPQLESLKTYPQVVIATPGRLVDHMERGSVWLDYVEVVVLDEADRMLDMGFIPQITRILSDLHADRQTLLFSATFPPAIEKITKTMMYEPTRISVGKPHSAAASVEQVLWLCEPNKKMSELKKLLREETGTMIVFSRSKKGVVELWQSLHSAGHYDVTMLHSDRTQEQRMQALADFKSGKFRVLIATDVAARGIDVANVAHVVNFDVPLVPEDYIHRIGRSGRASAKGKATSLVSFKDKRLMHDIEKMLGKPVPVTRDTTESQGSEGSSRQPSRDDRGGGQRRPSSNKRRSGGGGGRGGQQGGGGSAPPKGSGKLPVPNS